MVLLKVRCYCCPPSPKSFVHSFGAKGRQFESLVGITVDRNGFLYVCDDVHWNGLYIYTSISIIL